MSTIPFTPKKSDERPDESTLTDRQRKVLDAIKTHLAKQGFAPSFREIGEAAGLKSPSSVKHQLQVLDEKGFIRMNANKGRAIEVVNLNDEEPNGKVAQVIPFPSQDDACGSIMASHDVPLVGRIAAGVPITAEQHVDDVMRLPERLTGTGNLFMLEVHGDSMIDAAICDGDFVVVREQNSAENGDIVAALLDDEATVKTFRKDHGHVWLIPHNPANGCHLQKQIAYPIAVRTAEQLAQLLENRPRNQRGEKPQSHTRKSVYKPTLGQPSDHQTKAALFAFGRLCFLNFRFRCVFLFVHISPLFKLQNLFHFIHNFNKGFFVERTL